MKMVLSAQDKSSALWIEFTKHLETRIAMLRENNDHPLTPEETTHIRGQIDELKYILRLDKEDPQIPQD